VTGRCIQRQNVDAIQSQGLELEAGARVGDFDLDLSYDLIDAHVQSHGSQAALDGLRPAQTPHDQVNGTIAWRPSHGPSAAMTLHYVSRQFDDDQNQVRLRSAVTLDAYASMPVWNRLRAEVRIENLTNKLVDVGYSNTTVLERATPRTIWVGLRWGG
jgi:outer membrane receptor protein involved in Fe transport